MNVQIVDVTKCYGEVVALDGISFEVEQGEILGYIGPNGAGKSTTIKLLTGILTPTRGRILVDGRGLPEQSLVYKKRIGYVPEVAAFYESLTGFEFIQLVGRLYHMDDSVITRKANEMFELFDLADVAHHRLSSYSKGMRQKVLITSALIHNPDLIFLDEPLSGLDASTTLTLKELLRSLAAQGKTIFYCSHVLDVVERLCNRVVILHRGKIVADSSVDDLKDKSGEKSLEDVFQAATQSSDGTETASRLNSVVTGV